MKTDYKLVHASDEAPEACRARHKICRTALFEQSPEDYDALRVDHDFFQAAERTPLLLYAGNEPVATTLLDDFGDRRAAARSPLLLYPGNEPVTTTLINDFGGRRAAIRAVAVSIDHQGAGHGRALIRAVEDFARSRGVEQLCVNAGPDKTGFYARQGFTRQIWDIAEIADCLNGIATPMPVQMIKTLDPSP